MRKRKGRKPPNILRSQASIVFFALGRKTRIIFPKMVRVRGLELQSQRPRKVKRPVRLSISLTPPTKQAFDLDNRCRRHLTCLG